MDGSLVASQPRSCSRWANRSACTVLLVAILVSLSGCSSIAVFLGLRIRLDSLPVSAVSASLVNARGGSAVSALAPGQSARLVIVATSADPRVSEGKVAHVHIVVTAHPDIATDLDIPVRYDVPFVAKFSGDAFQRTWISDQRGGSFQLEMVARS